MKSDSLKSTLSAPITVTWEITRACNLSCAHCLSDSGCGAQTSLGDAKNTIDELASLGVFQVNFGGGEPLLHPDIFAILEHCVEQRLVTCLSTNGTMLTRDTARRLAELGVRVQVSLDGATEETNDAVRGKGTFRKALLGLRMLSRYQIKLAVNAVLTRFNCHELDKMYTLAAAFGARLRVSRFRPSGRGSDSWEAIRPLPEQLSAVKNWLEQHPDVLTGDSFFFLRMANRDPNALDGCGAGSLTCCISPEGLVYPCAFLQWDAFAAGKLGETSFATIWREAPTFKAFRTERFACLECGQPDNCGGGCPAVAYGAHGSVSAIDPECLVGCYQKDEIRMLTSEARNR